MRDDLAEQAVRDGNDDAIRAILSEICALTDMGFAAVARVTENRWIACQVVDKIEFGLAPGDELAIQTTICNEIRQHGREVVFDDATMDENWRRHPVPTLYGFKSYASFPILTANGDLYGTLCAIDPARRRIAVPQVVATMRDYAKRVSALLNAKAGEATADA
jgi:GAF domain-containing protein